MKTWRMYRWKKDEDDEEEEQEQEKVYFYPFEECKHGHCQLVDGNKRTYAYTMCWIEWFSCIQDIFIYVNSENGANIAEHGLIAEYSPKNWIIHSLTKQLIKSKLCLPTHKQIGLAPRREHFTCIICIMYNNTEQREKHTSGTLLTCAFHSESRCMEKHINALRKHSLREYRNEIK